MSRKADFTPYEWAQLNEVIELVGLGMLAASGSGPIGKLREFTALSLCVRVSAVPIQFRRTELIQALVEDIRVHASGPSAYLIHGDLSGLIAAVAVARLNMLSSCGRIAALLAAKCPQSEAEDVKRWLLWIARTVAEASGHRLLGMGRKLSDNEAQMLDQIATALQTTVVAAVPSASDLEGMLGLAPQGANGVSGSEGYERSRGSSG